MNSLPIACRKTVDCRNEPIGWYAIGWDGALLDRCAICAPCLLAEHAALTAHAEYSGYVLHVTVAP